MIQVLDHGYVEVLDHGYVELIEAWGSEERIIEAARMSTNKGFRGWGGGPCTRCPAPGYDAPTKGCPMCSGTGEDQGDRRLLRYLYEHKHATPFEMAGMVIEVQAPIFVFREWHRHRTQSYNELSARYTPLPDMNYVPTFQRVMLTSDRNKQAQGTGGTLNPADANAWVADLRDIYKKLEALYQHGLGAGVPKELARLCLPVGRYSRMRASANLRNWLAFLTLRMDQNAQYEIRQYANAVGDLIAERFPRTWQLFNGETA